MDGYFVNLIFCNLMFSHQQSFSFAAKLQQDKKFRGEWGGATHMLIYSVHPKVAPAPALCKMEISGKYQTLTKSAQCKMCKMQHVQNTKFAKHHKYKINVPISKYLYCVKLYKMCKMEISGKYQNTLPFSLAPHSTNVPFICKEMPGEFFKTYFSKRHNIDCTLTEKMLESRVDIT